MGAIVSIKASPWAAAPPRDPRPRRPPSQVGGSFPLTPMGSSASQSPSRVLHGDRFLYTAGLQVDSAPGAGTRIRMWLPPAKPASRAAPAQKPGRARSVVGKRILLVDDNAMVHDGIAALLRNAGLVVQLADSGDRALELLQQPATRFIQKPFSNAALRTAASAASVRRRVRCGPWPSKAQ